MVRFLVRRHVVGRFTDPEWFACPAFFAGTPWDRPSTCARYGRRESECLDPVPEEIAMLLKPGRAFVASLVAFALMPTVGAADNLRSLAPTEVMPGVRDYGFLWWADGWRGRSENGGKVLCVRTGSYGLALDVERLRLLHFGAITQASPADRSVAEDNAMIMGLPVAALNRSCSISRP